MKFLFIIISAMLLDSHTSLYIHNTMVQYLADRNKWLLSEEPGNETLETKERIVTRGVDCWGGY